MLGFEYSGILGLSINRCGLWQIPIGFRDIQFQSFDDMSSS